MDPNQNIPNTNWSERLFIAYFLQSFRLGSISFSAPASEKEFASSYPTPSFASGHEVLLLFPQVEYNGKKFIMNLAKETHKRIKQRPAGTAFYVGHTFTNASEINSVQPTIRTAKEFLRYFLVVEASSLPETTVKIRYGKSKISSMPIAPVCKYEMQLKTKIGEKSENVDQNNHYSGMHFRNLFSKRILGKDYGVIYEASDLHKLNPFVYDKPTLFDEMQIPVSEMGIFRLK